MNDYVFFASLGTLIGVSFFSVFMMTKKSANCDSVKLPQYQAATLEVGHKTCHFLLDNNDGTLHVALGASGTIDADEASKRLGHASKEITERVYRVKPKRVRPLR